MEKEFIPYEQALALKQLGFDEPCFAVYEPQEIGFMLRWVEQQKVVSNKAIGYIIVPFYQQAFRWFREKYNLDCSIMLNITTNGSKKNIYFEKKTYKYQIIKSFKNPIWIESDNFKTYEKAELECLKRLIEICKKK